ncbi:MAG: endonuclease III [Planctomycetota bacterium]
MAKKPTKKTSKKAASKRGGKKAAAPFSPESNPRGLRDVPFPLPQVDPNARRRARRLAEALAEHYPDAHCELEYSAPHELLIATILSAQATDAGVNKATPALFRAFRSPVEFAAASPEQIEPYIRTIGLFRNKAKSVHAAMVSVVEDFGGEVPRTMDELLTLRGVARKTANVVLGNAFDTHVGFVVDTHIERLAKRFGLAPQDATVPMVERYLMALLPRAQWSDLGHMLIFHGRRACKARGKGCADHPLCKGYGVSCERRES